MPTAKRSAGPVMADVAKVAGVSNQTISRVVNGTGYVAPRTRDRVLAAMREVGYHPNSAARTLVTGRSPAVGIIAMDTADYGPTSITLGFEAAAREHGYLVALPPTSASSATTTSRRPAT